MRFVRLLPLPALVLAVALLAALVAGCGSSDDSSSSEQSPRAPAATPTAPAGASAQSCVARVTRVEELRVTSVGCAAGRSVAVDWSGNRACSSPAGASRYSCSVDDYRCLGLTTDRGIAVNCARPGRSLSFIAKPR